MGVRDEAEFHPGQRVLTVEGYPGVVAAVQDGPRPGAETYVVDLDGGMGGGEYGAQELAPITPTAQVTALDVVSADLVASTWYPELGTTLVDHPPPPLATRTAGHHVDTAESARLARLAAELLTEANATSWRPDYPGEASPYVESGGMLARSWTGAVQSGAEWTGPIHRMDVLAHAAEVAPGDLAEGEEPTCSCCAGTGEHDTGKECYACGGGGSMNLDELESATIPCDGMIDMDSGESDDARSADTSIQPQAGWLQNMMAPPTSEYHYSWCRFKGQDDGHCYYPKGLDSQATTLAGYAVWQPVDRGRCPRTTWSAEQACPIGAPGPNVQGGYVQATDPYGQGGQRGGVPVPGYRDPARYASTEIVDNGGHESQHIAMPSAKSPTHPMTLVWAESGPGGYFGDRLHARGCSHTLRGRAHTDAQEIDVASIAHANRIYHDDVGDNRQPELDLAPCVKKSGIPHTGALEATVAEVREAADDQYDSYWHITDNPHFALDPSRVPEDNTFAIQERTRPGLYVTDSPERWVNGHGYVRPYAAEIHVPKGLASAERWGGERFIPAEHFDQAKVHRVIPLDAHAREEYGDHGWIEKHLGTTFDTGEQIKEPAFNSPPEAYSPYQGYHYDGPDARDMTPEQHASHRNRALEYLRGNNGWGDEDIKALKKTWASVQDDTPAETDQDAAYRAAYSYGTQSGDVDLAHAFAAWYVGAYCPVGAPSLAQLPDPAQVWDAFTGQQGDGQGVTGALGGWAPGPDRDAFADQMVQELRADICPICDGWISRHGNAEGGGCTCSTPGNVQDATAALAKIQASAAEVHALANGDWAWVGR